MIYKKGSISGHLGGIYKPRSSCAKNVVVTPYLFYKLGKYCCTEEIEISDGTLIFGGYGYVRPGMYKGRLVAVKTMKAEVRDEFLMIKKVSINVGHQGGTRSQPFHSSDFTGKSSSGRHYPIRMF